MPKDWGSPITHQIRSTFHLLLKQKLLEYKCHGGTLDLQFGTQAYILGKATDRNNYKRSSQLLKL